MQNAFKTTVILVGLLAFLFVFAVPDIPTPDGLMKEQPAIKPLLIAFIGVLLACNWRRRVVSSQRQAAHSESILELTCARLC